MVGVGAGLIGALLGPRSFPGNEHVASVLLIDPHRIAHGFSVTKAFPNNFQIAPLLLRS